MTREEKYDAVNACESVKDLEKVILSFADENGIIQGRTRGFDAIAMSSYVQHVALGKMPANFLTREFGIRQQALYLSYYDKL